MADDDYEPDEWVGNYFVKSCFKGDPNILLVLAIHWDYFLTMQSFPMIPIFSTSAHTYNLKMIEKNFQIFSCC